jgi:hypothetical protein
MGWDTRTDDTGSKIAQYHLHDRVVDIIYGVRKLPSEQQLEVMRSVSTESFSQACAEIDPGIGAYSPLVSAWNGLRIRVSEVLDEHVLHAVQETVSWAKEQDLKKALLDKAALPTDAPGARPIWHLAALGLLGDMARLESYRTSFVSGDTRGFVPYISKDHIDRAIAFSLRVSAQPS